MLSKTTDCEVDLAMARQSDLAIVTADLLHAVPHLLGKHSPGISVGARTYCWSDRYLWVLL